MAGHYNKQIELNYTDKAMGVKFMECGYILLILSKSSNETAAFTQNSLTLINTFQRLACNFNMEYC